MLFGVVSKLVQNGARVQRYAVVKIGDVAVDQSHAAIGHRTADGIWRVGAVDP